MSRSRVSLTWCEKLDRRAFQSPELSISCELAQPSGSFLQRFPWAHKVNGKLLLPSERAASDS